MITLTGPESTSAGATVAARRAPGKRGLPGEPGQRGERGLAGEPRLALGWALLAAVAGGLALTAAFPPVGAWPLAPAGPALLVLALQGRSLRASFAVGLLFGLALFVPLISWLINLAWYAWAALAIAEAVIFALLAVGQRVLLSLRAWPVAVAGWWVAAEALRDRWPYAFPWGRLAMSQAGAPAAPWTAIGGAPLLSFLLDQLWQRRTETGFLTFDAYRELGGLEGAVGRRAEEAFLRAMAQAAGVAFPSNCKPKK